MKRRVFALVADLVISGLLLASCASAPTIVPPAPPTAAATETPVSLPTPVPVEAPTEVPAEAPAPALTIWADESRAPILQQLGAAFTEQYGVQVDVQLVNFENFRDDFRMAAPAGKGPDIFIGPHDRLGEFVTNGFLAPVDLRDKEDQFSQAAVQAFTYDGKLYGVPYAVENVAFFRNPQLVPEAPATWDQVREIAAQLEAEGKVKQGYVYQEGDAYHFYPIMTAFGGYVFGRDGAGNYDARDVGVGGQGSIAAAEWLDRMVKEGHLKQGLDWEAAHVMFESGDAAMIVTGPWALSRIKEAGVPYAISNLPAGPAGEGRPFLGVQGLMVSAFSQNSLLAQTFLLEFVATKEAMLQLYEQGQRPPAFLPALSEVEDADMAAFNEAGKNGQPMPAIPAMANVWQAWGNAVTLVFQQQVAADRAFKDAATQINTLIGGQ